MENQFIADLVLKQKTVTWGGAWIGIQRNDADGKLYWIDGTLVEAQFTAWAAGNPSKNNGDEGCGHIFGKLDPGYEDQEGKWNDVPCNLVESFFVTRYPVILCQKSI